MTWNEKDSLDLVLMIVGAVICAITTENANAKANSAHRTRDWFVVLGSNNRVRDSEGSSGYGPSRLLQSKPL
jgi:hypothetical protein